MPVTGRWTRRLWIAGAGALALHGLVLTMPDWINKRA